MRNAFAIALAVGVAGCNWTTFDNLSDSTWVNSTTKPDQSSSDWGVAIARTSMAGTPGKLAVLGTNDIVFTALSYGTDGKSEVDAGVKESQLDMGAVLDQQPIFFPDPTTDNVSLVTPTPAANGAVAWTGASVLQSVQFDFGSAPSGAAYMIIPNSSTAVLFVGVGNLVLPNVGCPDYKPPALTLEDEDVAADNAVMIAAMAGVRVSDPDHDDLLVWSTDGKLYMYPDFAAAAAKTNDTSCPLATAATLHAATVTDTAFTPGTGAQLLVDGQLVVIAAEKVGTSSVTNDTDSVIAAYDVSSGVPTLVGTPLDRSDGVGLYSAALQTYDGQAYVFAGFPMAPVNGLTTGVVELYPYDGTNGIDSVSVQTLHDAQPDENELFGRSVAIMPYEGTNVLAVGASNEVFVYYQIVDSGGTPLYEDPRAN